MNFTADQNDGKHVFVFGSNRDGIHGKGAAKTAMKEWGAAFGVAEGRQGMSYAIPTKGHWSHKKGLALKTIQESVNLFLKYASEQPRLTFLVTRIGCGYAGYNDDDIAPMFNDAPDNCVLPEEWKVTK